MNMMIIMPSKMRLLLMSHLLFVCIYSTTQVDINICNLVEESMFCTCDMHGINYAHKVSCSVVRKVQSEDIFWKGFEVQRNIKDLTITSKPDAQMDFVPSPILRGLSELEVFTMRDSAVNTLWPYTFVNMSHLQFVSLERNGIHTLEKYFIAYLPELEEISLGENNIKTLPAEALYRLLKLKKLHLNTNNMTSIEDLAFVELTNLLELNLYSNNLHHLSAKAFVGLRSLHRLDLSRNKLTSLVDGVFSGTPMLGELDLWANHVAHISPHAFDGLNHLKVLQLTGNKLKHLQNNVFKGAPNLEQMHFSHNKFTTFKWELLAPLNILEKPDFVLHLKGNPLNCSCNLLWVKEISEKIQNHLFRKELRHLKCRNHTEVTSQHSEQGNHHNDPRIINLTDQDLSCPVTTTTTTIPAITTSHPPEPANIQADESTPVSKDEVILKAGSAVDQVIGKDSTEQNNRFHPQMAEARPQNSKASIPRTFKSIVLLSVLFCFILSRNY